MEVEITGTRIVYKLIAARPQSQKGFGLSVISTDNEKGEEEVGFHIRVAAVLGNHVWANVEEKLEVAKLNVMKARLG